MHYRNGSAYVCNIKALALFVSSVVLANGINGLRTVYADNYGRHGNLLVSRAYVGAIMPLANTRIFFFVLIRYIQAT
ncbi:hypothetical protein F5X98DRAFT_262174 [Xylaria grammica]|nr:hypothetical protein F5X98DRAFT_262174 [Xylaria grammica]